MGDSLPPDPYLALGVAKDATAASIKTQYRKLVLKFHPDKVTDESQKQAAADEFHKIQTAYEIVSDEARRARYDAQCKLSELRKDVMDRGLHRQPSDEERRSRYATPQETSRGDYFGSVDRGSRGAPQYSTEERRPSYAQEYVDPQPRTTSRKDSEYERASKRAPVREERSKSSKSALGKAPKEKERSSRKEKSRKSDRDLRQDRERKFARPATGDEISSSDSEVQEKRTRRPESEEKLRRVKDEYYNHERRQREQAENGYFDDRTRKLFTQSSAAQEIIDQHRGSRRGETERRPSPPGRAQTSKDYLENARRGLSPARREASSKDDIEYVRSAPGRPPVMIRRGSGRPQTSGHTESRRTREPEIVEDEPPREARRPPTLGHTQSSPTDIRLPPLEKQRSNSVQIDRDHEPPIPTIRRAETMPYQPTSRETRHKDNLPERKSRLRQENTYPTPETSPERSSSRKHSHAQAYAVDMEYATPDGYVAKEFQTEERRPDRATSHKRHAEEPVVARESRDRHRSSSSKHASAQPPPLARNQSSSTKYRVYDQEAHVRPSAPSREASSSKNLFYGEIPTSRSPANTRARYSPPAEPAYTRSYEAEPASIQKGYKTGSNLGSSKRDRPSMHRRDTRQSIRT